MIIEEKKHPNGCTERILCESTSRMMCFDVIAPTVGYDGTLHDHDGRRLELCETTIKKYGRPMLFLEAIVGCEADETTTNSERWRASAAVTKEMARRGLGVIDEDKSPRLGT
jgi:hypothetical protein